MLLKFSTKNAYCFLIRKKVTNLNITTGVKVMAGPRLDQLHVQNPQQRVTGADHLCLQVALGGTLRDFPRKFPTR